MSDYKPHQNLPDLDEEETDEWLESLRTVFTEHGPERARMLLHELMIEAELLSIPIHKISRTPYLNSIPINQQIPYPGNLELENKALKKHTLSSIFKMTSSSLPLQSSCIRSIQDSMVVMSTSNDSPEICFSLIP